MRCHLTRLVAGAIRYRMAYLRWWAPKVGKPNADYSIVERKYVSDGTKRCELHADRLALVKDDHARMSLRLQAAFVLRREEAIKFSPTYVDRGNRIVLKA